MKLKQTLSILFTLALILSLFTGCGASSKTEAMAAPAMPMEESAADMEMAAGSAANGALRDTGASQSTALPENRKWIINVYMNAETEDLDAVITDLDKEITTAGGYVEDQNIYNGSAYAGRRYRSANMTIRVPAKDVDLFTAAVAGIANVVSKEKDLTDVTLRYVSTESRVKALQTEETRLLELLAQADNMTDLLEIESRLTDVRYELENHASQLRLYDNQIDFATIHLNIEEVQEYTPVEEPTFFERIRDGFQSSLKGLWESLQNLLVWLIVASPFLLVYGGIAVALLLLLRKLRGKRPKTKKEKNAPPPPAE